MLIVPERVSFAEILAILDGAPLELPVSYRARIEYAADAVASAAAGDKAVYGINTGFGKLASVRISPGETIELQRNLVLSHCAGVGNRLPGRIVRLVMILKIISLCRGASGVRWKTIALMMDMLSRNVLPVIPGQGSVGASGDLAPLAHLAATLIGENEAIVDGNLLPGREALHRVGLSPVSLAAKEGIALINGTQVSTALALDGLMGAWRDALTSIVTGALSTDAAMGSSTPFQPEIHALRGHRGQIDVAASLRTLLSGSEIRESHRHDDLRVQDPYCLRCQPQVIGAVLTSLRQAAEVILTEARAVTDNPLVLEDGKIVSGGNFHGEPVGIAADQIAVAIAETGTLAQRRISLLIDPAMSFGLPPFLSPEPGLNSGFMAAEITSAALAAENKALANPRVVDSTPTSANQEDHVAMSCHGARRLLAMNENAARIIAVEALCSAQGVEMRAPMETSPALKKHLARIRSVAPSLHRDRVLSGEIEDVARLVRAGTLIPANSPCLEESS